MRIEPEQVRAVLKLLRDWGVRINDIDDDVVAEFDTREDPGKNKVGPFKRETSKQAAYANFPRSGTQREQILRFVARKTYLGATREEIAWGLNLSGNTVRPRVRELIEGGWLMHDGRTRKNLAGLETEILFVPERARRKIP